MWGVIPAAGAAARLQPLPGSKELVRVGYDESGAARPVCDYVIERMARAGAKALVVVASPRKPDIFLHLRDRAHGMEIVYVMQPEPLGLCDAIVRARTVTRDDPVLIGLPDTIWFPIDAFAALPVCDAALACFPSARPEAFDSVRIDDDGRVTGIRVKCASAIADRAPIWGGMRLSGSAFHALEALWRARGASEPYLGNVLDEWIAAGGVARARIFDGPYLDVGTPAGLAEARALLEPPERRP